jgi:hypothetical protein
MEFALLISLLACLIDTLLTKVTYPNLLSMSPRSTRRLDS